MNRLRIWDLTLLVFITLLLLSSNVLAQESIDKQIQELEGKLETLQKQVMKFGAQQPAISRIENLEHKVGSLDQLPVLEHRFETLEREVSKRASTAADVRAVTEVAKMTMASYESKFELLVTFGATVSVIVGLIFSGLAAFGYAQILRPLKKLHEEMREHVEEAKQEHLALTNNINKLEGEARANIQGLIFTTSAYSNVTQYRTGGQEDESWLRLAARDLKRIFEVIEPHEPKIVAWAHTINAYVLYRTHGAQVALESIECALKLSPNTLSHLVWFNAACYAAKLEDKKKWVRYLSTAIDQDRVARKMAIDDSHFNGVRDDPEFKRLTGDQE